MNPTSARPSVAWWSGESVPDWCQEETDVLGPTLADLLEWPVGESGGIVALRDAQGLAAVLPLVVQRRRVRGVPLTVAALAGDDFFDYLPGVCRPDVSLVEAAAPLQAWGRRQGWDALELRHQRPGTGEGAADSRFFSFTNRFFDAALDAAGWSFLTRKDSLKRHRNRARKSLSYGVEHYRGEIPGAVLAEAAALHRERWGFDAVPSLFEAPGREALYRLRAALAWVTVVRDGAAAVAVHLGFRHGDVVLWHTPVVNIRYLDYSPLEVLLLETAEACAREAVRVLDFGLGDEAYKTRFSNGERPVANFLLPISRRGRLAGFLRRQSWLQGGQARLRGVLARCRWWPSAAGGRRRYAKSLSAPPGDMAAWRVLDDFPAFVDYARAHGMAIRREHYERFRRGQCFLWRASDKSPAQGLWCTFEPEPACLAVDWPEEGGAGADVAATLDSLQSWAAGRGVVRLALDVSAKDKMTGLSLARLGFSPQAEVPASPR